MLLDINIQTYHDIQLRAFDIVVPDKSEINYHFIEIAVTGDKRIGLKEQEKVDNYSKLSRILKKIRNLSRFGCSSWRGISLIDIAMIQRLADKVKCKK